MPRPATRLSHTVDRGPTPYDFHSLRNTPVKAVITDLPWGDAKKVGYPTDPNYDLVMDQFNSIATQTVDIIKLHEHGKILGGLDMLPKDVLEKKAKSDSVGPFCSPLFFIMADLETLNDITSKFTRRTFIRFTNTPGMILYDRPRATERRNNAPMSGGTWYMMFGRKTNDAVLDWNFAERDMLPPILQNLGISLNYRCVFSSTK